MRRRKSHLCANEGGGGGGGGCSCDDGSSGDDGNGANVGVYGSGVAVGCGSDTNKRGKQERVTRVGGENIRG